MNKAYLAGFIAGTMGKTWEHCPFKDGYSECATQWRVGQVDGYGIFIGNSSVGSEEINDY